MTERPDARSASARPGPVGSAFAVRPTLALGSIETYARCGRRLASLFDEDRRYAPSGDARFRLVNEVVLVIRSAHTLADERAKTVAEVLDDDPARALPPDTLSTEEQAVFRSLVEQYREAFGDHPATLDLSRSGATQRRDSASGLFTLSGRTDLVLNPRRESGEVDRLPIVRRVHTRQPHSTWADPGYAVLLRLPTPRAANDVVLRIERMWASPVPGASENVVTGKDVDGFRTDLLELITHAPQRRDVAEPGWWCGSCPMMRGCPAVAQQPFEELVANVRGPSGIAPSWPGAPS